MAKQTFSEDEQAAMREAAKERRRVASGKADGEPDVLAKIAQMPDADRVIAERVHAIVRSTAPDLKPRTWYGMPAWARDGKVVCFLQSGEKFKNRYATLGFSDRARLDDGAMWPTSYAIAEMTGEVEERVRVLVEQAVR